MNTNERNELVVQYLPLAQKIAWTELRKLPKSFQIDEILSAAYMGLVSAASRYDASRGVSFSAFAAIRINGEIQDYLRQLKWGSRYSKIIVNSLDISDDCRGTQDVICGHDDFYTKLTNGLSERDKSIFLLYYRDGLSLVDIAEQQNIGKSRVSQILKSCRNSIKTNFTEAELRVELAA